MLATKRYLDVMGIEPFLVCSGAALQDMMVQFIAEFYASTKCGSAGSAAPRFAFDPKRTFSGIGSGIG
jgi:hypothetical protein